MTGIGKDVKPLTCEPVDGLPYFPLLVNPRNILFPVCLIYDYIARIG